MVGGNEPGTLRNRRQTPELGSASGHPLFPSQFYSGGSHEVVAQGGGGREGQEAAGYQIPVRRGFVEESAQVGQGRQKSVLPVRGGRRPVLRAAKTVTPVKGQGGAILLPRGLSGIKGYF